MPKQIVLLKPGDNGGFKLLSAGPASEQRSQISEARASGVIGAARRLNDVEVWILRDSEESYAKPPADPGPPRNPTPPAPVVQNLGGTPTKLAGKSSR